jgi:hypothetical protein
MGTSGGRNGQLATVYHARSLIDDASRGGSALVSFLTRVPALAAYKDFVTLWKDADPDIPTLKEAKAKYSKLHLLCGSIQTGLWQPFALSVND